MEVSASSKYENDRTKSKDSNSKNINASKEIDQQFECLDDKEKKTSVRSYSSYRKNAIISQIKEQEMKNNEAKKQESENIKLNEKVKKHRITLPKGSKTKNVGNVKLWNRPTTVRLKIEEKHESVELIREIVKSISEDGLGRIASIGNGVYHIGFRDVQVMSRLLMDGFLFKGKRIQPVMFDNRFNIVTIKDLPINIEPKHVIEALSQYGETICHKMVKYEEDLSWLETGEMKIGMFVSEEIPNCLMVENEKIMLSCRQLVRICNCCKREYFVTLSEEDGEDNDEKCSQNGDQACNENTEENCTEAEKNPCYSSGENNEKVIIEESQMQSSSNNCEKEAKEENEVNNSSGKSEKEDSEVECSDEDNAAGKSEKEDSEAECTEDELVTEEDDSSISESSDEDEIVSDGNYCKVEFSDEDDKDDEVESEKEEDGADDEDSGYYLENSNNQSGGDDDETRNVSDKDKNKNSNSSTEETSKKHETLPLEKTTEVKFLDTISTSRHRSDFDCKRVLVTLMEKIQDSLSVELGRNVNRILLAKAMDNHSCWEKWYSMVQDRKIVNWRLYYWKIAEEYQKLAY